jgi:hypothetical protein
MGRVDPDDDSIVGFVLRHYPAFGAVAVGLAIVGVVAVGGVAVSGPVVDVPTPSQGVPSTAASSPTGSSVSVPPRPARLTMQAVRREGGSQQFRAHTGPASPPFSQAEALRRAASPDAYSLGLWDVGLVSETRPVEWHSVWVTASEKFVADLNQGSAFGGSPDFPLPATSRTPWRGWVHFVTMYDGNTGKFLLGYEF